MALTGPFCFGMVGFWLLLRETLRPQGLRTRWLALGGAFFGLAVLTRPTYGATVAAMAGVAYLVRHDGRLPRELTPTRRRAAVLVVGIPVLAGLVFMVYNALRFSGPLDFGNKYQQSGRDVRDLPWNSLGNLVPAFFGYLVAPLRIGLEFPYVHLPPPPKAAVRIPAGMAPEPTASIFWSVPLLLLAVVALGRTGVGRIRGRGALAAPTGRVVAGLAVVAAIPFLLGIYAVPGYTERYELDFLPCLTMAAVLGWAELMRTAVTPRRAALWRRGGVVLTVYGVIVGVAIGFTGYYDDLETNNLKTFQRFERLFSPLPTAVAAIVGHPVLAAVSAPAGMVPGKVGYSTLGPGPSTIGVRPDAPARMTVVSPGRRTGRLRFVARTGGGAGRFVVTVTAHGRSMDTTVAEGSAGDVPIDLRRGVNYVAVTMVPLDGLVQGQPPPVIALDATDVD